jgi:hypothetical protein
MMHTIETTATVMPNGTLIVPLPSTIVPGPHRVVVVIEEALSTEELSEVDREAEADQLAALFAASVTAETPLMTSDTLSRAGIYQDHS